MRKKFRKIIKEICIEQRQIAKDIGVSDCYLSLWLSGKRPMPEWAKARIIAWMEKRLNRELLPW